MTGPPPGRGDRGVGLPGEGRNRLPERLVNRLAPVFVTRNVARHRETESRASKSKISDEALVRALYAEHAGPLLRYALRLTTGDRQRAEDIVQETLLRAWLHPEAIAERPARPWLFAVARNLAVDAHRARSARPREVGEAALELVPVADGADRALESWAVADALRALRPEHRQVLVETYYLGRSVAEAAASLGIPGGTVKSRTFYALRALKLALEELPGLPAGARGVRAGRHRSCGTRARGRTPEHLPGLPGGTRGPGRAAGPAAPGTGRRGGTSGA
jgi:RNA polymerase sigma-70 factor (ECF subfamily)